MMKFVSARKRLSSCLKRASRTVIDAVIRASMATVGEGRPQYLRALSSSGDRWFREDSTDILLNKAFDIPKTDSDDEVHRVSVFEVKNDIQEARSYAANYIRRTPNKPSPGWGLRICDVDLEEAGIKLDNEAGGTGVRDVDECHRDLVGTKGSFRKLAHVIKGSLVSGEDRVRRFDARQVVHQYEGFVRDSTGSVTDEICARCRRALA